MALCRTLLTQCLMLTTALASADVALEWKQLTPSAPFSARSDMCSVVIGNTLVMTGGHADNSYSAEVWTTTDGVSWNLALADAPWAARSYHSCVVLPGGRMLIVGGHSKSDWFNDAWVSGANGNVTSWTAQTTSAAFQARAAGSLMLQPTTGVLFYLAGSDGLLFPAGTGATLFNDVWSSADEGKTWTLETEHAPWAPREGESGGSGVAIGDDITVIGGEAGYFPNKFFGDVWTSADGANWVARETKAEWVSGSVFNYKGRSGHIVAKQQGAAGGGDILWLSGGYLGRNDVWCIGGLKGVEDLAGAWTRINKAAPFKGRYDHIMKVLGNRLILFGGENSALGFGGPYFNDVWAADLPSECP